MPARAVDRKSPLPLWTQVQRDLRRRLARGEFRDAFPPEKAVGQQYSVSRNTAREALRALRAEGLVTAERGRMPRLAEPPRTTPPVGMLWSLFASVEASGMRQSRVVRKLDVRADGVISARVGLEESTPLVYLERLWLIDESPLALDRVWLQAGIARPLLDSNFTHAFLHDELKARAGVRCDGGSERIEAVVPSPTECRILGSPPGVGAFAIIREGTVRSRPIEWRQTLVRGDRFVLEADLSHGQSLKFTVSSAPIHRS